MLLLQDSMTALHQACSNGHIEVIKYLINNQADISAIDNVSDSMLTIYQESLSAESLGNLENHV